MKNRAGELQVSGKRTDASGIYTDRDATFKLLQELLDTGVLDVDCG